MDNTVLVSQSSETNSDNSLKYIYVMISQTHTKFGKLLRKIGHLQYNHAAIALDAELNTLCAFARPQHNALLLARLVPETVIRYTLGKSLDVPVVIFKVGVTPEKYDWIADTISNVSNDDDYIYNLVSVLTFPIAKGIHLDKSFSCIEFVMYLLQGAGYDLSRPLCKYQPDELLSILAESEYFNGNLLDYKPEDRTDMSYFAPFTFDLFKKSLVAVKKLFIRTIAHV